MDSGGGDAVFAPSARVCSQTLLHFIRTAMILNKTLDIATELFFFAKIQLNLVHLVKYMLQFLALASRVWVSARGALVSYILIYKELKSFRDSNFQEKCDLPENLGILYPRPLSVQTKGDGVSDGDIEAILRKYGYNPGILGTQRSDDLLEETTVGIEKVLEKHSTTKSASFADSVTVAKDEAPSVDSEHLPQSDSEEELTVMSGPLQQQDIGEALVRDSYSRGEVVLADRPASKNGDRKADRVAGPPHTMRKQETIVQRPLPPGDSSGRKRRRKGGGQEAMGSTTNVVVLNEDGGSGQKKLKTNKKNKDKEFKAKVKSDKRKMKQRSNVASSSVDSCLNLPSDRKKKKKGKKSKK